LQVWHFGGEKDSEASNSRPVEIPNNKVSLCGFSEWKEKK
jgi:hypothetical protein